MMKEVLLLKYIEEFFLHHKVISILKKANQKNIRLACKSQSIIYVEKFINSIMAVFK